MNKQYNLYTFICICVVQVLIYGVKITNKPLWAADDIAAISENYLLTQRSLQSFVELITTVQWREFSPVGWAFIFSLSELSNMEPIVFRIACIILHILNSYLLFILWKRVSHRPMVAATVALIFSAHPKNTELIGLAAGLMWLLSGLFGILAILCALKRQRKYTWAAGVLLVLGCLSKSGAVIVPALVFVIMLHRDRDTPIFFALRKGLTETAPLFLISLTLGLMFTFIFFSDLITPGYLGGNLFYSIATHLLIFIRTTFHWIFPLSYSPETGRLLLDLTFEYDYHVVRSGRDVVEVALYVLGYTALIFLLWLKTGRSHLAATGFLFFLTSQILFLGISKDQFWHMADRYGYFGGTGLFIALVAVAENIPAGLQRLISRNRLRQIKISFAVLAVYLYSEMAGSYFSVLLDPEMYHHTTLRRENSPLRKIKLSGYYEVEPTLALHGSPFNLEKIHYPKGVVENFERLAGDTQLSEGELFSNHRRILYLLAMHEAQSIRRLGPQGERFLWNERKYPTPPDFSAQDMLYLYAVGNVQDSAMLAEHWLKQPQVRWQDIQELYKAGTLDADTARAVVLGKGNQIIQGNIMASYFVVLQILMRQAVLEGNCGRALRLNRIGAAVSGPKRAQAFASQRREIQEHWPMCLSSR